MKNRSRSWEIICFAWDTDVHIPTICALLLTMTSASRSRLERFSDKLRDLLRRDAQHLKYKTFIYGECCSPCVLRERNILVTSSTLVRLYAASLTQSECCAGALLRWDEGEVNEVLTAQGAAQRRSLGGAPGKSDRQDGLRGRDGRLESSGEEEADDIFESEFVLLKDLWNFDNVPFPVTKQVRVTLLHSDRCTNYLIDFF